jgi:hypothetical protein
MRYCKVCRKEINKGYHGHILSTYCSDKCKFIGRKTGPSSKRICEQCDKEFFVSPSVKGRFCSLFCANSWRVGKKFKYNISPKEIERRKLFATGRKQSKETILKRTKKIIGMFVGKNNPAWKGGITPIHLKIRMSRKYITWREKVFTKDNYTCQMCGDKSGGSLQAHHILPFGEFPEYRFRVDNGKTLCKKCHVIIRRSEWKYIPRFMNI